MSTDRSLREELLSAHHLERHSAALPQEVEDEAEDDEEDGHEGERPPERHAPVLGQVHGEVD